MKWNPKIVYPLGVISLGILGTAILIGLHSETEVSPPAPPPPLVRVLTVQPQNFHLKVLTQGTVAPRTESMLISQVSGQILWVAPSFASGGFFQAGDLLVRLDQRDYESGLAQARFQVAKAKVRLSNEKEEARIAREEWIRIGQGEPTPLVFREPQLAEAQASLEAAQAVLNQAQLNLDRTELRAPYDCRVRTKLADVGQVVNTGTSIAKIYAVDYSEVRLPIPDADLAFLDLSLNFWEKPESPPKGPKVYLTANFAGNLHTWEGQIVRVEGEIDSQNRMIHLVARVEDPYGKRYGLTDPPLAVGLFVEAEILGRKLKNVVVFPRSVLRDNLEILVIDGENRLQIRQVEVIRNFEQEVIIGSGLIEGERVCISSLDAVVDGMKVRVSTEEDSQRNLNK